MQEYVVGFLFDEKAREYCSDRTKGRVALIEKNRPAWQAGYMNGIGGHVESGENPDDAMRREFEEETGVDIDTWEYKIKYEGPDYILYVYSAFSDKIDDVRTVEDELIYVCKLDELNSLSMIYNLNWFIPFLLDPNIGINNKIYEF